MKTISYRGKLAIGLQDRIRLRTIKGEIGYKITKFQLFPTAPHTVDVALVCQIFKKDQTGSISAAVDFTNSELMGVAAYEDKASSDKVTHETILFDNEITNQDIFVTMTDADGNTTPANYYIELETIKLSDIETTQLTLKSLRTVTSR